MADLFGLPDSLPTARKPKPAARPAAASPIACAPADGPAEPEIGPRFGTPEWDRCKCGRWASLHFPFLGGIRRCNACAKAEGFWTPSQFPVWGAVAPVRSETDEAETPQGQS